LTTASQAGKPAAGAGAASDTGILISGSGAGVGYGTSPEAIGTLSLAGVGAAAGDGLSGSLTVTDASGVTHNVPLGTPGTTDTLQNLATDITNGGYGITATYSAANKDITFTSASTKAAISGTSLADSSNNGTTDLGTLGYAAAGSYYSVGVTNSAGGTVIEDAATSQGGGSGFTADPNGSGGIATISYSDASGQDLSNTNLTDQANAQAALNDLNLAISAVAAQDGYIGAQINTLNSISQVMSTQGENLVSAQNAIQATDYASATSNMSKYEILSQTGIAALAQANTVQQEVTKLLQ
jgi:flagellin